MHDGELGRVSVAELSELVPELLLKLFIEFIAVHDVQCLKAVFLPNATCKIMSGKHGKHSVNDTKKSLKEYMRKLTKWNEK